MSPPVESSLPCDPYTPLRIIPLMEADRINQIENSLHDLASRAQELRRYL